MPETFSPSGAVSEVRSPETLPTGRPPHDADVEQLKAAFRRMICTLPDPNLIARMNEEFTFRTKWFSPAEILRQATSKGGELLGLSKRFNPGKLGVIEEGALADILLINGNPLEDISIMTKPEENLALIMKDGKIYKNTVK